MRIHGDGTLAFFFLLSTAAFLGACDRSVTSPGTRASDSLVSGDPAKDPDGQDPGASDPGATDPKPGDPGNPGDPGTKDPKGDPGGKDPGDPGSSHCIPIVIGDGSTCIDGGAIKGLAAGVCEASGYATADIGLGNDCPNGGSTIAKVLCCDAPPAPPPPSPCTFESVGDGVTCVDPGALKGLAVAACGPLAVADVSPAWDCADGGATMAKVVCCPY